MTDLAGSLRVSDVYCGTALSTTLAPAGATNISNLKTSRHVFCHLLTMVLGDLCTMNSCFDVWPCAAVVETGNASGSSYKENLFSRPLSFLPLSCDSSIIISTSSICGFVCPCPRRTRHKWKYSVCRRGLWFSDFSSFGYSSRQAVFNKRKERRMEG